MPQAASREAAVWRRSLEGGRVATAERDASLACSFCRKTRGDAGHLVEGPGVQICEGCVELCQEAVDEQRAKATGRAPEQMPRPREIRAVLDEYIVGQDRAKQTLAVAVYNHYKRIRVGFDEAQRRDGVELAKANILLIGPTGSGKTLLAQTLARILDVPFAVVDATTLTQAGYVGEDVDGILLRLLQAAEHDIEKAKRGIVYIDEIDKCARRSDNAPAARDVAGEGVQQALLKILEGSTVSVSTKDAGAGAVRSGRGSQDRDLLRIDTSHILFIAGGAFSGLERIVEARISQGGIGFGGTVYSRQTAESADLFAEVTPEDLVRYGMIPEFIGRLPVITSVRHLDRDTLLRILTEPADALVKQYRLLFELDGVELEFAPGALEAVADRAILRGTGARGLRAILEEALLRAMYEVPSLPDVTRIVVSDDVVFRRASPALIMYDGTTVGLSSLPVPTGSGYGSPG